MDIWFYSDGFSALVQRPTFSTASNSEDQRIQRSKNEMVVLISFVQGQNYCWWMNHCERWVCLLHHIFCGLWKLFAEIISDDQMYKNLTSGSQTMGISPNLDPGSSVILVTITPWRQKTTSSYSKAIEMFKSADCFKQKITRPWTSPSLVRFIIKDCRTCLNCPILVHLHKLWHQWIKWMWYRLQLRWERQQRVQVLHLPKLYGRVQREETRTVVKWKLLVSSSQRTSSCFLFLSEKKLS